MKIKILSILALASSLVLSGCGGNINNVVISDYKSEIYTDDDIESAFHTVKTYFKLNFDDCKLTKLGYYGDTYSDEFNEYAERYDADEAIIIGSSFDVSTKKRGDGLSEGSTHHYCWILVRNENEDWKCADYGY